MLSGFFMLYKCKIRLSFFEALILNCFCLQSQETAIIEDHPDLKKHRKTRLGQLRDDPDLADPYFSSESISFSH